MRTHTHITLFHSNKLLEAFHGNMSEEIKISSFMLLLYAFARLLQIFIHLFHVIEGSERLNFNATLLYTFYLFSIYYSSEIGTLWGRMLLGFKKSYIFAVEFHITGIKAQSELRMLVQTRGLNNQ